MGPIQVQNINIELIKINAVKLKTGLKELTDENETEVDKNPDKKYSNEVSISFKQKEKNQNFDFYVTYRIPLNSGKNLSFDAELLGSVNLKDEIDIGEIFEHSDEKKWFNESVLSRILEAVDTKLVPVFNSIDFEYEKLA